MSGLYPCDVCESTSCWDCCLNITSTKEYQCANYSCFLNHEGDCLISAFDKCGAWKKDGGAN